MTECEKVRKTKEKHQESEDSWCEIWLRRRDLNPRPPGYEPDELPTALLRDIELRLSAHIGYHTKHKLSRGKFRLFLLFYAIEPFKGCKDGVLVADLNDTGPAFAYRCRSEAAAAGNKITFPLPTLLLLVTNVASKKCNPERNVWMPSTE